MNHLVIGLGEVGGALRKVLGCSGHDPALEVYHASPVDVVHICFPFTEDFSLYVRDYQDRFKPVATVIHSTVPVGTSQRLGCLHSPVRGVHPVIDRSLLKFEKLLGYDEYSPMVVSVKVDMERSGIPVRVVHGTRTTEAAKLWETTQYGVFILLEKEIYAWCAANKVSFDEVYTEFNRSYNEGYENLNMDHYRRPILKHMPGPIGGHCVVPNARLLDSESARRILDYDAQM